MGRYYNGDIEGKFWFAIQSSDDADFFGVEGTQPVLNYYFQEEDLDKVKEGVDKCLKELGKYKEEIDLFFKDRISYNDKALAEYLKVDEKKAVHLLTWYARLGLGQKILKCLEENGECEFEAEL